MNDELDLHERKPALRAAPRMTMARLPQWIVDTTVAEERDHTAPQRMTMSRSAPFVRTTIGRQR